MPDDPTLDLELIARHGLPVRRIDAGEPLFLEGDVPAAMYVVTSGLVHILRRGRVLEDVRAGGVVGELAMIDEHPRSAAAMAGADSEVAVIDRPALLRLLRTEPVIALAIMRILARRIRAMNRRVGRD